MAGMLGKAYFDKQNYEQALPFLERGLELQPNDRSLAFRAGVAAQKIHQHEKAIAYFEKTFSIDDTTSQLSAYYAAFSALELKKQDAARLFFRKASQGVHPEIKADALFQYGKISCQLREYHEALNALQFYLSQYAQHKHVEEAKGLIGEALMYSGQFAEAIQFFEKSLSKDKRIQESFQKTCFYFGIQLAEKKALDSALIYLKKAININIDEHLTLSAKFWTAELYYEKGEYAQAEKTYDDFIDSHNASEHPNYPQALAGYGWSVFQRKDYKEAITAFQKSLQRLNPNKNTDIYTDVVLRLGDCYFVLKEYEKASGYYTQIINQHLPYVDYALFQNGLCFARKGKYTLAVQNFEQVIANYPNSSFRPKALDEASEILIVWLSDNKKGSEYAKMLIDDYPNHALVANAYLHLGIAAYNSKDEKTAEKYFRTVVLEYGNYESQVTTAFDALTSIIDNDELEKLRKEYQIRYPNAIKALEGLTFNQARDKYYAEEYEEAISQLTYYLETYPVGKNRNEALLMRGDSYEKRNQEDLALKDYQEVLNSQLNPFTSQAIKNSAAIYQKQKKYAEAEKLWLELDSISTNYQDKMNAKLGLGDLYLIQTKYHEAKKLYQNLLDNPDISEYTKTRASVQLGKALMGLKEYDKAQNLLKKVASEVSNALGAESQYLLTVLAFEQKNYDDCRTQALVFREKFTGYNDWKAKAYFFLAQAYWQKKEHFQAIETLKSLLQVPDKKTIHKNQIFMMLQFSI
jgi:tetratricopeptide (TPR) repeat protein